MTQNLLRVAVASLLLLVGRPALAHIAFTDGFESGTTNWTLEGKWAASGDARSGSAGLSFRPSNIGGYGYSDATLRYDVPVQGKVAWISFSIAFSSASYDYVDLQINGGGSEWTTYRTYGGDLGGYWQRVTLSLIQYQHFSIRFRAYINPSYTEHEHDYWSIDDVEIDDGASNLAITAPVADTEWEGASAQTVAWTYDGSITGASSFTVSTSMDGGSTWTDSIGDDLPISATSVTWTVPEVNTSKARVRVQARDNAGNVLATVFSSTFTIFIKAPPAPTLNQPPNERCGSTTQSFSWSSVAGATAYSLTITPSPSCSFCTTFKKTVSSTSYTLASGESRSSEGSPYSWTVQSIGSSGRPGPASESRTLFVDTKSPGAFSLVSPADATRVASGIPSLTWTASTDIGSGIARYDVYLDKVLQGSTDPATLSFTPAELGPGAHVWYVRAYDICNLFRDSSKAFTFAVGNPSCVAGASEPCAGSEVGLCRPGTRTCSSLGEWGTCVGQVLPTSEICNGKDDNCDGQVDEGLGACVSQPDAGGVMVPADASLQADAALPSDASFRADASPQADASRQDRPIADAGSSTAPADAPITTPTADAASIPGPADAPPISRPTDTASIPLPADALVTAPPPADAASTPGSVDASGKTGPVVDAGAGPASADASSPFAPASARKSGGCSVSTSSHPDWRCLWAAALLLLIRRKRR